MFGGEHETRGIGLTCRHSSYFWRQWHAHLVPMRSSNRCQSLAILALPPRMSVPRSWLHSAKVCSRLVLLLGQNVAIEYRSAGGKYERLPALAAELVKIPAAVIAATGGEAVARAAKAATSQIPIVFTSSSDVVKGGLVASLNRPGGNVTGVSLLGYELDAKRLQLLRELLPRGSTIGVLMDANNPAIAATLPQMKAAADANGQRLVVLDARTEVDIDATFASLRSKGVDALLVTTNPFYEGRRDDIVALAKRYSMPVLYPWREYSVAGGLISYGTSFT